MGLLAFVLTFVFVTLKLAHVVAWSWLAVFSPLIIAVVLTVLFFAIGAAVITAVVRALAE